MNSRIPIVDAGYENINDLSFRLALFADRTLLYNDSSDTLFRGTESLLFAFEISIYTGLNRTLELFKYDETTKH
jgi:hypothetical protein